MTRYTENGHEGRQKRWISDKSKRDRERLATNCSKEPHSTNFRFFSVSATSARIHGRRSEHVRRGRSSGARGARVAGGESMVHIQGSAKRLRPGLVNCVPAVAYHFCQTMSEAFTQPGAHFLAETFRHYAI